MRRIVFIVLAVLVSTVSAQMDWTRATPSAPWAPRAHNTLVTFHDTMWLTGGVTGFINPVQYNDVWKSADGARWMRVTDSAAWSPRFGCCPAVFHDTMWLVGGARAFSAPFQEVWCSADGMEWFCAVESAPWLSNVGTLVVFHDTMWLTCGLYWNGGSYVALDDVWKSGDGRNWMLVDSAAPWGARAGHGLVVLRDTIWLTGGHDWGVTSFSDVWKSGDGDSWIRVTYSAPWGPKYMHASVVTGDSMWVMGGWTFSIQGRRNDVWWSTDGDSWVQANDSAGWKPRGHPTATVHDSSIWVMAGDTTPGTYAGTNDVWRSEPVPGIEDRPPYDAGGSRPTATIACGVLWLATRPGTRPSRLLDISGRTVMRLRPGPNDIRHLAPGIYFARPANSGARRAVNKVVVTR